MEAWAFQGASAGDLVSCCAQVCVGFYCSARRCGYQMLEYASVSYHVGIFSNVVDVEPLNIVQ